MEMFGTLTCPELDAFIMAHQDAEKPQFTSKSKIPKKGSVAEASEETAFNKIRLAYDCRTKPNSIEGKYPYELSVLDVEEDVSPDLDPTVVSLGKDNTVLPSDLLGKESWIKLVIELFDLEKLGVTTEVTAQQMEHADLLVKILRDRFREHLDDRVKKKSLHSHWSMKLAYRNLSVSAAYMVLVGHIAIDLESLTEADGLLAGHTANFFHASRFPDREGAYLYYDKNRGCFIRSGKVNGRGVSVRDDEHLAGAKGKSASSNFYHLYPSSDSPRAKKRGKQGLFDNLEQIIAAAYDPSSDVAKQLDKDWTEGGLLILSEKEKEVIRASLGKKKLTSMQKFHYIVSYQFEFEYDLALIPGLNVLKSPGFESFLGIFGGKED